MTDNPNLNCRIDRAPCLNRCGFVCARLSADLIPRLSPETQRAWAEAVKTEEKP